MPYANLLAAAAGLLAHAAALPAATSAGVSLPDNDVIMRAMADELERSMRDLVLADLPRPYFMQYRAEDRLTFSMAASYGGLQYSDFRHSRGFHGRTRVGSFELDNANFGRSGGQRASLPLDDDYIAIRHSIWRATDRDYKQAVETLARKKAYLKDKNIKDRPNDYSPAEPVVHIEPSAELAFDRKEWENAVRNLSARFKKYPRVQDASVTLFSGVVNDYIVNSEGTRLRVADTGVHIQIVAEIQAEEGMYLADSREYLAERVDQLPSVDEMLADVDRMCTRLTELASAPILEHYTGPVLFEPVAAGKVFHTLLGEGICARPAPLGRGGSSETSLEKKLGLRILPSSFQVYDDPRPDTFEGKLVAGHYIYDDEAVPARRVDVVVDGKLRNLLASRSPTRKITESTGHARSRGMGAARASVGCLYISDDDAVTADELKARLREAAREEGLEYGLRIESMDAGGYGVLGTPIYAYKVFVEDGREELVRGLEFLSVRTSVLKRILAAGRQRKVYNAMSPVLSSVIAPAVILEELELTTLEEEFDKRPVLDPPELRR